MEETQPESNGGFVERIKRLLGIESKREEIHRFLDESEEKGLIDQEEGEMIEGIVDLKQTVAREIMIPRIHIDALPRTADKQTVLDTLIRSGHSRIPVYKDNVDSIVGILNAKDLLPLWRDDVNEVELASIWRAPFFVPETKRVKDLLREMRAKKSHMAIIVDEYGGTSGIVTIEDIVEEIIG
ncbi:MAG: CBS domain-containing protein, partial [Pseudomonadota bacterium]